MPFMRYVSPGASQADVAILVINAAKGEFETGFEAGGQTREHALLARSLGRLQLRTVSCIIKSCLLLYF